MLWYRVVALRFTPTTAPNEDNPLARSARCSPTRFLLRRQRRARVLADGYVSPDSPREKRPRGPSTKGGRRGRRQQRETEERAAGHGQPRGERAGVARPPRDGPNGANDALPGSLRAGASGRCESAPRPGGVDPTGPVPLVAGGAGQGQLSELDRRDRRSELTHVSRKEPNQVTPPAEDFLIQASACV